MPHHLVRARAPLRLGFGGGTTDVSPYCDEHGGVVLNATIDLFAHVTLERRTDRQIRLVAADQEHYWNAAASSPLPVEDPLKLLRGVYNHFTARHLGGGSLPLTITTYSDCPPGSGLGSSSALVVALVAAFARLLEVSLSPQEIAALAFDIERRDLGLAGGHQDGYAAAHGGLNFMHFADQDQVTVEPVAVDRQVMQELEASLVLYFTGVSRESASIIDEQTANMKRQAPGSLEALHEIKACAFAMRQALQGGDLASFGALLDSGWASKKRTASKMSSAKIDEVYSAAKAFGAFGGKVSGAGGGGFMVFLIDPTRRDGLQRLLATYGGAAQPARFTQAGVESWVVR